MLEGIYIKYGIILTGIITVLSIIHRYLTRIYNYWSKQCIAGPKPMFLFGNIMDQVKYSLPELDMKYNKQFGSIYGLFYASKPVLHIADPELIKQVLVKDFNKFINRKELKTEHRIVNRILFNSRDERWKVSRSIASSTFTSGKMKKLNGLIRNCLQGYLEHFGELAEKGTHLHPKRLFENLTLDVISSCAFATQTDSLKNPNNPVIINSRKIFDFKPFRVFPTIIFPKYINKVLNIKSFAEPKALEYIIDLIKHIIQKRIESGNKNNDFLQLLIDAKESENTLKSYLDENQENISSTKNISSDKSLSEDEIIAQAFIFLLAGYETTATTLGYMSYELALNPECQQRLYEEIENAMDSNKEIGYEDLHSLEYLDACVSETLRKYPPLPRLEREVNEDFNFENVKIKLEKGQLVEIPVYAIHHSEKFYENPEQYIPDRFLKQNRDKLIAYTYLPFGTGPRNCIGMRFALMEVKLAMAHIILRYRFKRCDKTEDKIKFKLMAPVLSPMNITIGIEKR